MFGREVMHNFDKMLPESADPEELKTWDQFVQALDEKTRRAFEVARETIGRNVLLQKKYYDNKANLIHYEVGDAFMMRDHRRYDGGEKKFADRYVGPFYVLDVLSDVNFRVARTAEEEPQIIHHDRMKKIENREKRDIEWVLKASRTLQRRKAKEANYDETMTHVLDRLTKLENHSKYAKRKYNRREAAPPQAEAGADEQQPVQRRPGRPRKKKPRPAKREVKRQHLRDLAIQDKREEENRASKRTKPKTDKTKPREGERKSTRLREQREKK